MRRTTTLASLLIVLAGCTGVGPDLATTGIDPTPDATSTEGPDETPTAPPIDASAPRPNVTHGLVGDATTRNQTVVYSVATTGPVTVTVRLNGTVHDSGLVDTDREWNITLPYGRTPLNVTIHGPGLEVRDDLRLVRLAPTRLTIDYCHFHPSSPAERKVDGYEYWVDMDARPSAPLYHAQAATPKDAFTVHDQLVVFEDDTGIPVVVEYSASFSGFFVEYIDRAGNPASSDAPPYWLYEVNGQSPPVGMSLQALAPDDDVRWFLSTFSPPCQ